MASAMARAGTHDRPVPRIHWTARASLYLSLFLYIGLPLVLDLPEMVGGPVFGPLAIHFAAGRYIALYLPFPALVLSGVALVLALRSAWRRGLEFALIGLVINGLLCLEAVWAFWILCCFRLHIVF